MTAPHDRLVKELMSDINKGMTVIAVTAWACGMFAGLVAGATLAKHLHKTPAATQAEGDHGRRLEPQKTRGLLKIREGD